MNAHLIGSEIPLTENQTMIAKCGTEVPRAKFVTAWDATAPSQKLDFLQWRKCCSKCKRKLTLEMLERERYLYGIVSRDQEESETA